ncbi:hypothetical protein ACFLU5_10605 [Bacteroidota bacterium]
MEAGSPRPEVGEEAKADEKQEVDIDSSNKQMPTYSVEHPRGNSHGINESTDKQGKVESEAKVKVKIDKSIVFHIYNLCIVSPPSIIITCPVE